MDSIKQKIVENAKIKFLQRSYDDVHLTEICRDAGITTGAFYRRFYGKKELIQEVFMKIYASGEDYREAVLILQKQMGESAVRSVDLARHMGFSKPSISHAVSVLRDGGLLTMDKDGFLHLTVKGREIAEKIMNVTAFSHNG